MKKTKILCIVLAVLMIYMFASIFVTVGLTDKEMKLTYGPAKEVKAPIIMESPLSIECKVKEIIPLGTHDMFLAEVVNVQADDKYLNPETGEWDLSAADPLVYAHGKYFHLGEFIGKFGWSVKKESKK